MSAENEILQRWPRVFQNPLLSTAYPGYGVHSKAFGLGILLHVQQNDVGAFSSAHICTIEDF